MAWCHPLPRPRRYSTQRGQVNEKITIPHMFTYIVFKCVQFEQERKVMFCKDCGTPLSDDEIFYYRNSCNNCEQKAFERYERWRNGGEDEELDELYSAPEPMKH